MKVAILSNQARSMANFWQVLIGEMRSRQMEVIGIVPPGDAESDRLLEQYGLRLVHYRLDRKGVNPLRDLATFMDLLRIFKKEKPDMLFATTIKPVIYGCMAAHYAKAPCIFATITGLGYAFETETLHKKIINRISRLLYRQSLKHATAIFFQNRDDSELFRSQGILQPDACVLMARGTGVDVARFAPVPFPPLDKGLTFLLIGRLLEAKGIPEYARAAAICKRDFPGAKFQLLGPPESGPGSLAVETARGYGDIEYLGQAGDVRPFIAAAHVIVLPSWREGTPTSIMEAMSMGRPCVVTDVPGCREVVIDGKNGWLAEARNPESLAAAMEKFLKDPDSVLAMGERSRQMAIDEFDARVVARGIVDDMIEHCPCRSGGDGK